MSDKSASMDASLDIDIKTAHPVELIRAVKEAGIENPRARGYAEELAEQYARTGELDFVSRLGTLKWLRPQRHPLKP